MNILILGLLLLVAAAAILGAVLLSLSDQRASRAARAQASVPPPAAPAERPPLVTRRLDDAPAPVSATLPTLNEATNTNTLPYSPEAHDEEFAPPTLNGQFHELASEIRQLHQQASHLEQRLGVLTEMVAHIEQSTGAPSSSPERTPA